MRRRRISTASCLLALCCLSAASAACVKSPRTQTPAAEGGATAARPGVEAGGARVNINSATPEELERLPGIGPALAARIVEHRERYGPFRRAEHLLVVRGVSESRFKELRPLITVD